MRYSEAPTALSSSYKRYAFASQNRAAAETEQGISPTEVTSGEQRLALQSVQKDAIKHQDPEKRLRSAATVAQQVRELEKLYAEAQRQLAEQRLIRQQAPTLGKPLETSSESIQTISGRTLV